jgi:predicted dehydrogenase
MQIRHSEDVGNVHQSHSFVRGNWGNAGRSTPMILQKSCHDMDILQWLVGKPCTRVQSFGTLSYFTAENRPEGAPDRCIDGCPVGDTCPYNAVKLYLEDEKNGWFRRSSTQKAEPTNADVEQALRTTNYGRCVFATDNDVVDHQIVNLEFEGNIYANFSMAAFNKGGREIFLMGTEGTLHGKMSESFFTHYSFRTRETTQIAIADSVSGEMITGGHGGGDEGIMNAFFARLDGTYVGNSVCSLREACENHLIAFAAEESRLSGTVVSMKEYEARMWASIGIL